MGTRTVLLYCVIAVLLNTVLALGGFFGTEIKFSQKQADQIIELRLQQKVASPTYILVLNSAAADRA